MTAKKFKKKNKVHNVKYKKKLWKEWKDDDKNGK